MAEPTMEEAQRELDEAIDEVTDWLEYEGYSSKSIEPSLKRLNSARLRMLVLQQRARNAGVRAGHVTLPREVVSRAIEHLQSQATYTPSERNKEALLAVAGELLAHVSGVATPLSDFIRNASPERKAEVFGRVMDNVTERQQAVIAAAGGVSVAPDQTPTVSKTD